MNLSFKIVNIVKFICCVQCRLFFRCIGIGSSSTFIVVYWDKILHRLEKHLQRLLEKVSLIFSNCLFICHASEHWNSYWRVIRSKNGCDGGGQQRTCVIHTNLPSNGTDMIHIAGHARVFHPALQLKLHRHFLRSRGSCCCYCGHLRRQREATRGKSEPIF